MTKMYFALFTMFTAATLYGCGGGTDATKTTTSTTIASASTSATSTAAAATTATSSSAATTTTASTVTTTTLSSSLVFTNAIVSGKNYSWTITGLASGSTAYKTDGTMTSTPTGQASSAGTWSINSSGKLVVTWTSADKAGTVSTYTINSVTGYVYNITDVEVNSKTPSSNATYSMLCTLLNP